MRRYRGGGACGPWHDIGGFKKSKWDTPFCIFMYLVWFCIPAFCIVMLILKN